MAQLPRVIPMLSYEDCSAAAEWLASAFGFREHERYADEEGRVTHVTLSSSEGGVVMIGWPSADYECPKHHAQTCEQARRWLETPYIVDGVYVSVEDVDAHFERARAAGARILSEPEDQDFADRHYRVEDLEGHRWMFAQHIGS
jgi:uncharacterized glyoxalase superfamily protein PhnB